ncbi:MAG TPA: YggT family protein [Micromonosporaceae bacterium]|jgi:YggT family protein|nr:YggT family protein [Micromonosporaceae bacterium]HKE64987.1 YggT family protein [Micromonosporaceae bacterium]
MKSIIGQALYLVLYVLLLLLFIRLTLSYVLQYARRWRPGRGAAASLELVWTVTDPPLHALRRVIPPLRIGTVSIDIAFLVLLLILYVLLRVVAGVLI